MSETKSRPKPISLESTKVVELRTPGLATFLTGTACDDDRMTRTQWESNSGLTHRLRCGQKVWVAFYAEHPGHLYEDDDAVDAMREELRVLRERVYAAEAAMDGIWGAMKDWKRNAAR